MTTVTKATTELVSSLAITAAAGSGAVVIYSLPITAKSGDAIEVNSQFVITTTQYVGIGQRLLLASTGTAISGTTIVPNTAQDFTPPGGSDHLVRLACGSYQFTADFTGFINLVGYAYNSSSYGGSVTVEPGYGQISCSLEPASGMIDKVGLSALIDSDVTAAKTPNQIFTDIANFLSPAPVAGISGGTLTTDGTYNYHTFTNNSPLIVTGTKTVDYLIVAAGGSGAGCGPGTGLIGGAGAAGEVKTGTITLSNETVNVIVGQSVTGGAQSATGNGLKGGDSTFKTITAEGGQPGGAGNSSGAGQPGGSGKDSGGGGYGSTVQGAAGVGTVHQGAPGQSGGSAGGGSGSSGDAVGNAGGPGTTVWGTLYAKGGNGGGAGKTNGVKPATPTIPGTGGEGGWSSAGGDSAGGVIVIRVPV